MGLQRSQGTVRALFYSVNLDSRLTISFKNANRKRRLSAGGECLDLGIRGYFPYPVLLMAWEHHTEPLAPHHVFLGRMARQILVVAALVVATLAMGTAGYMSISDLDFVDSFLESSMLLSGAGPLYTERSSTNELKMFSSLFALFSTLVVVSSVGIFAAPVVHRVLHRLHVEKGGRD
jgi:hypothetical protein